MSLPGGHFCCFWNPIILKVSGVYWESMSNWKNYGRGLFLDIVHSFVFIMHASLEPLSRGWISLLNFSKHSTLTRVGHDKHLWNERLRGRRTVVHELAIRGEELPPLYVLDASPKWTQILKSLQEPHIISFYMNFCNGNIAFFLFCSLIFEMVEQESCDREMRIDIWEPETHKLAK